MLNPVFPGVICPQQSNHVIISQGIHFVITSFNCGRTFFRNAGSNHGIVLRRKHDSLLGGRFQELTDCSQKQGLPIHAWLSAVKWKQNITHLTRKRRTIGRRKGGGGDCFESALKDAVSIRGITRAQMENSFVCFYIKRRRVGDGFIPRRLGLRWIRALGFKVNWLYL